MGHGRAGQAMAGHGSAWQGRAGHAMALQGMQGVAHMAGSYHSYESSFIFYYLSSGSLLFDCCLGPSSSALVFY